MPIPKKIHSKVHLKLNENYVVLFDNVKLVVASNCDILALETFYLPTDHQSSHCRALVTRI